MTSSILTNRNMTRKTNWFGIRPVDNISTEIYVNPRNVIYASIDIEAEEPVWYLGLVDGTELKTKTDILKQLVETGLYR